MKSIVRGITYNWGAPHLTNDYPETFSYHTVGENNVTHIVEHLPMGDGDRLYYDVFFSDGSFNRIFNPNEVSYITQ